MQKLERVTGQEVGETAWKDLLKSIFAAQAAAQAYGATITQVTRLQTENQQEAAKLLTDTQKRSTEGRMVDSLERELELRLELNRAGFDAPEGMSDEEKQSYRDRGNRLQQELDLFRLIDTMKAEDQKRIKAQTAVEKRMLTGRTKLVAARLKLEMSLMKNEDKRLKIQNDIDAVTGKIALNNGIMEPQQRDMLELSMLELANLEAQNRELERKLDYTMQIKDTAAQAFESGLEKTFASFIKGEEKSLREGMLKLAEGVLSAVADTLAKQMTEQVMGLLGIKTEAQRMKDALIEGADYWVDVVGRTLKPNDQYLGDPILRNQPKDLFNVAGLLTKESAADKAERDANWRFSYPLQGPPMSGQGGGRFGASNKDPDKTWLDIYNSCVDINNSIIDLSAIFNSQRGANVNTKGERGNSPQSFTGDPVLQSTNPLGIDFGSPNTVFSPKLNG